MLVDDVLLQDPLRGCRDVQFLHHPFELTHRLEPLDLMPETVDGVHLLAVELLTLLLDLLELRQIPQ